MMNKKGQIGLNKKIEAVAILIIIVIVLFSIYSSFIPEVQTAGDSMNDSNRCNAVGCFFNSSAGTGGELQGCRINSSREGNTTACASSLQTIPLSSLFRSGGIVVLLLMVGLLIAILKTVLPKGKK